MITRPLVSVIVPIYNSEKYVHECVDSVIRQTYDNIEILLIDDGSTDNSGKICDEYAASDSRIRVFHQSNHGLSYSRNVGLHENRGDYVAFIDSDDSYYDNTIEILLSGFDSDDVGVTCAFYSSDRKTELEDKVAFRHETAIELFRKVYKKDPFVWDKMYRSDILID